MTTADQELLMLQCQNSQLSCTFALKREVGRKGEGERGRDGERERERERNKRQKEREMEGERESDRVKKNLTTKTESSVA